MNPRPVLRASTSSLYPYNTHLEVKGEFMSNVSYANRQCEAIFQVINGSAGNLLSFETSRSLNLFNLPQFSSNKSSMLAACRSESFYVQLMQEYNQWRRSM